MFTHDELLTLRSCVELKLQSLTRGLNSRRDPAFKPVYEREISVHNHLLFKIGKEMDDVKVQEADGRKVKS